MFLLGIVEKVVLGGGGIGGASTASTSFNRMDARFDCLDNL